MGRAARRALACATLLALAATPAWAAAPPSPAPEPGSKTAPPATAAEEIQRDLKAGRFGTAVFRCERAGLGGDTPSPSGASLRTLCALAYLGLGDKLAAAGAQEEAGKRWSRASDLDPRLLDDPAFVARLLQLGRGEAARSTGALDTAPPHHEHEPPGGLDAAARPGASHGQRAAGVPPGGDALAPPESGPAGASPATARAGRTFGVGLSTGFDGLLALDLAWLYRGRVAFEVSAGLLYRTLDTRVRLYGTDDALTPVVGLGLVTPFGAYGEQGRAGVRVERYESLYRVGQAMHVDVGLSWAVWKLDLFAGVAFLTSLDQEDDLRLLFFPQYAAQALIYF